MNRADLVDTFAGFPGRLDEAATAAAGRSLPAGEWSPAEVVRHLIAVEREVWQKRLARLATEDDPRWSWVEPGLEPGFEDASIGDTLAAFAAARATTTATIRALDAAGWVRHGTHATYGPLDVAGLLRIAVDHDRHHLESLATKLAD